jgi:Fic-DOC domain mobile mystery protein B
VKFRYPPGATPLDPNETTGLIPKLTTQAELNEFEAANIADALLWLSRPASLSLRRELPTIDTLRELHRRMFGTTWTWAGSFRRSNKNLGVPSERISVEVRILSDDVVFQVKKEAYPADELAVRFHHRLVSIHAFANGNGRHARLSADVLVQRLGRDTFSWGRTSLVSTSPARTKYLEALRKADGGDATPLVAFARS